MDEEARTRIIGRNEAIIAMVIGRAKRDFPEDIAIVGVTGSYATGDFHEGSDLDLIIVNQTERGWGISHCFILGDVGFDIYCTPWNTRIEAQSKLESPMVSCLVDLDIRYCAKPAYRACCDAQDFYDEMRRDKGTPVFDLAGSFDPKNLGAFRDAFLASMEDYLEEYRKVGLEPAVYSNLEELSGAYLGEKA